MANSWENAEDGWLNKTVNEKITFFRILVEKSMCYTCGSRCLFPHQTFRLRRHVDGWLLLFCTRYSVPPFVNLVMNIMTHKFAFFISKRKYSCITFNLLVELFRFTFFSLGFTKFFFFFYFLKRLPQLQCSFFNLRFKNIAQGLK